MVHLIGYQAGQPVINDGPSYPAATGRLDHIAFSCVGLKEMRENLKSRDLKYDERVLPRLNMTQLFYPDPDGISVECNFPPEETEQRTARGTELRPDVDRSFALPCMRCVYTRSASPGIDGADHSPPPASSD